VQNINYSSQLCLSVQLCMVCHARQCCWYRSEIERIQPMRVYSVQHSLAGKAAWSFKPKIG